MNYDELTIEQKRFVDRALERRNILVDACIGSGKTTAIQTLCNHFSTERILYLTYNKLLKLDAQRRIRNPYVRVTNYHGFGWQELARNGIQVGVGDIIQTYNKVKPDCQHYDILILDEYQDIEEEISYMLQHIKDCCPNIQIIAVGDMAQKIYDKTRLDVQVFIREFLDSFIPMEFTQCFRIGESHAAKLGRIWEKTIHGVNPDFQIRVMQQYEIQKLTATLKPEQLLVLGSNSGERTKLQNYLEKKYPDVFNKTTVWSKISDQSESTSPTPNCAIFTTYDGCKGMEREVCVLYDWSKTYWNIRLMKPNTRYEILRNIFCVAASRAKRLLIIADVDDSLSEEDLINPDHYYQLQTDLNMSNMFDFKYIEDVELAYSCLDVKEIQPVGETIDVPITDELIDLSFCVGNYQEAMYFENYDIHESIEFYLSQPKMSHFRRDYQQYTMDQKILYLAMLETGQQRYCSQVTWPIVTDEQRQQIAERLSTHLPADAVVQQPCSLMFCDDDQRPFSANGMLDAVVDRVVYELKFVSVLSHVHVLQTAMYLVSKNYAVGRLWNVRTNQMYEIRIPDISKFLDRVTQAVTKGSVSRYLTTTNDQCEVFSARYQIIFRQFLKAAAEKKKVSGKWVNEYFANEGLQLPVDAKTFILYVNKRRKRKAKSK